MGTTVQSCRIRKEHYRLLVRQAKRRNVEVGTLSSLYLTEKALEEEFPGIGFRDAVSGREAYVLGHRVAVWEVADANQQTKSVARTAAHFSWPPALVRTALDFAATYSAELENQRAAELAV